VPCLPMCKSNQTLQITGVMAELGTKSVEPHIGGHKPNIWREIVPNGLSAGYTWTMNEPCVGERIVNFVPQQIVLTRSDKSTTQRQHLYLWHTVDEVRRPPGIHLSCSAAEMILADGFHATAQHTTCHSAT
jgi:hypothetical protein